MTRLDRMEQATAGEWAPTICAECTNLYRANKTDPWWRWMCMASKAPTWLNPVTGIIAADPPYKLCKSLNNGNCEMFKPGTNSLSEDKLKGNIFTGEHLPKEE